MSARDALSNALWDNYRQAEKNAFIDAFAHELAEQIRAQQVAVLGSSAPPETIASWAADLIDPEAQEP